MAKQDKALKTGFVIKLSSNTVQKLAEEEQKAKQDKDLRDAENILQENVQEKDNINIDSLEVNISKESNDKNDAKPITTMKNIESIHAGSKKLSTLENPNIVNEKNKTDLNTIPADSQWGDYTPYITYENDEVIYTDPTSLQIYTWNKESNKWDPKPGNEVLGRTYSYENDTHVYTEADGSKFFWDEEKKAWIPNVDDDFLAFYQMSYGFVNNTKDDSKQEKKGHAKLDEKKAEVGIKRKNEPQWFQPCEEKNTKVYVSNLPLDLTEEEFVNLMQKCGLVERDPSTQKMRVKLYTDKEQDCFKGDALCTYIKIESVDLALKLLDGSDFKGQKIKVERAHFQMKGEYNPSLKPKKKKKKELEKIKKMQQKLFDWRPEKFIGERSKHEKTVIVKNLFRPSDFDSDVQLILDYQQDLREECAKCGEVRKVVIYDRHPEGVAQITMKEPEQADAVIQLINGRWFGKRQITAETWDGRTKYRIAETDAALNQRLNKWDKFLETGDEEKTKVSVENEIKISEKSDVSEETEPCSSDANENLM